LRRREFEKDILRMPLKTAYEVEINKILFSWVLHFTFHLNLI
jgi:hypothetical protein